jgi:hypothetical protein
MSSTQPTEREQVILAATTAATANPNWITSDMVDALMGGHGQLNIATFSVVDILVSELKRGADNKLRLTNSPSQGIDELLSKTIKAAMAAGAMPANAALISAVLLYLTGTRAQIGVPAGNRKLGATARMIAGVDRCGVSAIPTSKKNNKVSGFPAVMALYEAMRKGELSPISGYDLPISGGPLIGHGALGEDIIFPVMADKGARIATKAMMDAFAGGGMKPSAFNSAVIGAAAILEIMHPDAAVADEYGPYEKTTTTFVAGKAAAETAGLPEKITVQLTGQEYSTGQLIGDLGLIFKDIGGPSVIGIMAVDEMMGIFTPDFAGHAGPVNPPLGHISTDAVIAMKLWLEEGATQESVSDALRKRREEFLFDPEISMISMNIVAKKAAQLRRGPVTDSMILASEPVLAKALYRRAAKAYDDLKAGKELGQIVRELDDERKHKVERNVGALFSKMMNKSISLSLTHIGPGARRNNKLAKEWMAFDTHLDVEVTIDGVTTKLERMSDRVLPDLAQGKRKELTEAFMLAVPLVSELMFSSSVSLNVTVPAAVAVAMGRMDADEAAKIAQKAGYISCGIPGADVHARLAGRAAKTFMGVQVI